MKIRITQLLLCTITAAFLLSCTKEDSGTPQQDGDPVAARIYGGMVSTRAHDGVWDENDAIGLAMLIHQGQDVVNDVYNYHYFTATSEGVFTPRSIEETIYFPQDGSLVSFRAYYPYYPQLQREMYVPIDVSDQNDLPEIDFMSADHITGFSKSDPEVHLHFHHRLSKLIFNLSTQDDQEFISVDDCVLTVHGMKTSGEYHLLDETLGVDDSSTADLVFPKRDVATVRHGIVMPREAGPGVVFEFSAPDGSYTARMSDTLNLRAGYQYTFNIVLGKTPAEITAEIEPWIDGPTSYYDVLQILTGEAGSNDGAVEGDKMNVYLEGEDGYGFLQTYNFTSGSWKPLSPVYWQDIEQNPATIRSSIVRGEKLNDTQLPDIIVSDPVSVARNSRAHLTLRHAASKAIVRLTSGTFSDEDLANAQILFPDYIIGGYEQNGAFVEGTQKGNIIVDRTDTDNGIAIFNPVTIPEGGIVARVIINQRNYDAIAGSGNLNGDFIFNPGEATTLIINLEKTGVSLSAEIVDWETRTVDLAALTIGTSASGGIGVLDGEILNVYTGDADMRNTLTSFEYDLAENTWTPQTTVYWESLPDRVTFYGDIFRHEKYDPSQLDDYLIATPATVTASNGVNFELSHAAARVAVQLTSSDNSFSKEELEEMTVTLPEYASGGYVDRGVFIPGTGSQDINIYKQIENGDTTAFALIQPQTINSGTTVASLYSPSTGRTYQAVDDTRAITFAAGVSTTLRIDLKKTAVSMSAIVTDWVTGETITLIPQAITIEGRLGDTDDFFAGKSIHIYKLGTTDDPYIYSYDGTNWSGTPIYWDDLQGAPLNLTAAYYPLVNTAPDADGNTASFPWTIDPDQSGGYQNWDLLMSNVNYANPDYVRFNFRHVLSRVRVNITSKEFTDTELQGMRISLNNLILSGNASMADATVTANGARTAVTPQTVNDGMTYQALVMPQTVPANSTIVSVTLKGYPQTPFTGALENDFLFVAGKTNVINIELRKTKIEISASLEDWEDGDEGNIIIQ